MNIFFYCNQFLCLNQVIEYLVQYKQSESQIYTYTDDTEKKIQHLKHRVIPLMVFFSSIID